jgi:cysteine desulfurase
VDVDRLYLDYNATSPLSTSVNEWLKSGEVLFANPASQHISGKQSRKVINQVRTQIISTFKLNESVDKLFFHSGATEGLFSVFFSFVRQANIENKKLFVFYSPIDHAAVLNLEEYKNNQVEFIKLNLQSDLSYDHQKNLTLLRQIKRANPQSLFLYHHLWVHNETGLVSSPHLLEDFKSEFPDFYIHIDSVQAPGKILEWRELSVADYWTFSGHKFGSLKGIGFTIIKGSAFFKPLLTGGGQQSGLRGGTENIQGIQSLGLALADLEKVDILENTRLKNQFKEFLKDQLCGLGEIVEHKQEASNTIYFYLNKLSSDVSLALFDLNGLMLSAGSACSSGASKSSAVLTELSKFSVAKNGLRISFSFFLDQKFIDHLKNQFQLPLDRIRALS